MNNQGKRPDQLKTSEKIVFYCLVAMVILFAIQGIIDIVNSR